MLQFGPCFYMSMTGMKGDRSIQKDLALDLRYKAKLKTQELRELVGDTTLNPQSPQQLQALYYDVLLMPPDRRKGKSTDKRVLANTANMHPLYKRVIGGRERG